MRNTTTTWKDRSELIQLLKDVINEVSTTTGEVSSTDLRRANRKVYDNLRSNRISWQDLAHDMGYRSKIEKPGTWKDKDTLLSIGRKLYKEKGKPPTREEIKTAGFGSANIEIDRQFGGLKKYLKELGLDLPPESGRDNDWAFDDTEAYNEIRKYASNGMVPKASRIRELDTGLEAGIRSRFGSWQAGAKHFGFSVEGVRQRWTEEKIERLYLKAMSKNGEMNLSQMRHVLSSAFIKAVYYYFGGFEKLRTHLGLKTRKLTSPQGFPVESHQELFVSKYFFAREIPAERKVIKLKNGRNLHPDFIIFDNGFPVVIEVSMVESIDCLNSSREEKYAGKLEAKINTYNENYISHTIVTPSQINIKTLDNLFLKFQPKNNVNSIPHKKDNLGLGFLSPVQWTLEKIEKEIIRASKKCGGYFPTQSELKKFGKTGTVNAIYRLKQTLSSMQLRMGGLPVRPNLPTPPVPARSKK